MPAYRLHLLDAQGRSRLALDLDCRDDQHARRVAVTRAAGVSMELWRESVLVQRFEADQPPRTH